MLLFMLWNSSMEGQALSSINNVEAALEKEQYMFLDIGPGEGGVPDPLCCASQSTVRKRRSFSFFSELACMQVHIIRLANTAEHQVFHLTTGGHNNSQVNTQLGLLSSL